ncbi:MAG: dihydrolipoamide succinyltransferase [Calditrichaeota bacterium]|nr:MAG: dihydrolipoamide succinyltransferase [Calditrichota bacterium]
MPELIDIVMPESEEGTQSVMERWLKQVGEYVNQHEPILEINTDKVTMEIAAPASGILKEILKEPNESVEPGEVLGRIEVVAQEAAQATSPPPSETVAPREGARSAGTEAAAALSPAVKRLIRQHNLDPAEITGTGRGGRITVEDVERYLKAQKAAPADASAGDIPGYTIPHNPLRRRTAAHMVESMLKTAPHVTAVFEADLAAVVAHREKHKAELEKEGVKLTYTAYVVEAAVKALQAVPQVNARWHEDYLEVFTDYNIGIATAVEGGLVVPVLHRAQDLDLFGIARRLQELIGKAREGRLDKEEVSRGTFTITNHGMTGSLIATPIIHQPQVAILGIGKLEKRVVVVEKEGKETTEIRPRAYVTLTVDHRALDGFTANQFLTHFVEALQKW